MYSVYGRPVIYFPPKYVLGFFIFYLFFSYRPVRVASDDHADRVAARSVAVGSWHKKLKVLFLLFLGWVTKSYLGVATHQYTLCFVLWYKRYYLNSYLSRYRNWLVQSSNNLLKAKKLRRRRYVNKITCRVPFTKHVYKSSSSS